MIIKINDQAAIKLVKKMVILVRLKLIDDD